MDPAGLVDFAGRSLSLKSIGLDAEHDRIGALTVSQLSWNSLPRSGRFYRDADRGALAAIAACRGAPEGTEQGDTLDALAGAC
jgi:hypothetical protein